MATESSSTPAAEPFDYDVFTNRIAVAMAKREAIVKSWTAKSSRPREPPKTQEQIDAENAEFLRPAPAHLGLGAPIPKEYLEGDLKRKDIKSNDSLRKRLLGKQAGLQASKPRDAAEKAASAKRARKDDSSDEEEGRTSLIKSRKLKAGGKEPVNAKANSSVGNNVHPQVAAIAALKEQSTPRKKLVDYSSSEEGSRASSTGLTSQPDSTNTSSLQSIPQTAKSPSTTPVKIENPQESTTSPDESKEATSTPAKAIPANSKQSSSADSDSSDSEMETAIPQGLTADVIAPTGPSQPESNEDAEAREREKKRAKNRKKQQRKREKAKLKTEVPGQVGHQKAKDRLLDANGNQA
jgi:hypothetical protein